jgi:hypothetical protein
VVNECINHGRGSAAGAAIDGQPPKVGPVHRVVSTRGASRTSIGKNGRWVLYECPVRMKEHKSIDRIFIASVSTKNHRTFRRCYGLNIQNLTDVTIGVGTNECIRARMKRWTFV